MQNNDKLTNSILFEFDTVFDIDFGIIKLMIDKFNNPKFLLDYVISGDDYFIKCLLFERESYNPLSIILKPEYSDQADSLLAEMMSKYETIIYEKYMDKFSLYNLIKIYQKNQDNLILPTVYCRNDKEAEFLEKFDSSIKIVKGPRKELDINKYGSIFVKKYEDFLLYAGGGLMGKYLSTLRYGFNLEQDKKSPLVAVSAVIGDVNKIRIVVPYSDFEMPITEYDETNNQEEEENGNV